MSKRIVIEINEDGDCSVDAHGFHGPDCDRAIREIEAALGTRTHVRHKPEYAERQVNRLMQREGGR